MVDGVDALFDLPLADFVKARDALAKQLRAAGDKEGAAEVKALRKPTRVAWALNQVARQQADVVDDVLAAAADMRRSPTRKATEAWQHQVARVVKTADAPADKVSQALYAIAVDDDAQEEFRAGRMIQEPEPGALPLTGLTVVADDEEEDEETVVDEKRMALERAVEEARRRATDASRRAVTAAEEAERLEQRAREARERADEARREAEQAAAALARAEKELG